jgi:hypothetical protein
VLLLSAKAAEGVFSAGLDLINISLQADRSSTAAFCIYFLKRAMRFICPSTGTNRRSFILVMFFVNFFFQSRRSTAVAAEGRNGRAASARPAPAAAERAAAAAADVA